MQPTPIQKQALLHGNLLIQFHTAIPNPSQIRLNSRESESYEISLIFVLNSHQFYIRGFVVLFMFSVPKQIFQNMLSKI